MIRKEGGLIWTLSLTIPTELNQATIRTCWQTWLIPKRIQGQLRQARRFTVNGHPVSVSHQVKTGDILKLQFLPSDFRTPTSNYQADSAANLAILYEDQNLLVVNKAAGLKTHPNQPGEVGTLMNHLAAYLAPTPEEPYMVHRLDQQTSGAIIVAKNPIVVPILNRLISSKQIKRQYLAWVHGQLTPSIGEFTAPIGHDPADKRKRWIDTADVQPAFTDYQVIQTTATDSLVQLDLQTGRTHQLRVHLAASHHPILGDPLYDPAATNNQRLMLHAAKLHLILPFTTHSVTVTAPLPAEFKAIATN